MENIEELLEKLKTNDRIEFEAHALNFLKEIRGGTDTKGVEHIIGIILDNGRPMEIRTSAAKSLREAGTLPSDAATRLTGFALNGNEPMDLRWTVADVLEYLNPGLSAMLSRDRDLGGRPGKGQPSVPTAYEAIDEIAKKQEKQAPLIIIIPFSILAAIIGAALLYGTSMFVPYIVAVFAVAAVLIVWMIIASIRCPKCKKFFAKSGKKFETSYDATQTYVVSTTTSLPAFLSTKSKVRVYRFTCRYCGHVWRVLR